VIGGFYTADELAEGRPLPTPLSPLPSIASTAEIQDAEIVDNDEQRIVRLLSEAETVYAVKMLAQEAIKIWPSERPESVKRAHWEAKKRTALAAPESRSQGEDG
jgi:hypothetical protein